MLIKLTELQKGIPSGNLSLNEIYVNSDHIISVSDDLNTNQSMISEGKSLGLGPLTKFSRLVISEGNATRVLVVVGSPADVHNKVKKRQVLRG